MLASEVFLGSRKQKNTQLSISWGQVERWHQGKLVKRFFSMRHWASLEWPWLQNSWLTSFCGALSSNTVEDSVPSQTGCCFGFRGWSSGMGKRSSEFYTGHETPHRNSSWKDWKLGMWKESHWWQYQIKCYFQEHRLKYHVKFQLMESQLLVRMLVLSFWKSASQNVASFSWQLYFEESLWRNILKFM